MKIHSLLMKKRKKENWEELQMGQRKEVAVDWDGGDQGNIS